jgi:hypothetical protein
MIKKLATILSTSALLIATEFPVQTDATTFYTYTCINTSNSLGACPQKAPTFPYNYTGPTPTPAPSATPVITPTPTPTATPIAQALAFVSSSTGSNNLSTGGADVIPAPTSIASGNLLVAVLSSGSQTWSIPSGWSLYNTVAPSGDSPAMYVFTKIATASEPSSYTFTPGTSPTDSVNGVILQVAHASTTAPISGFFSNYGSAAAVTVGTGSSIPTTTNALPIAVSALSQLNLSNTGNPTGINTGWTAQGLSVNQDSSNYGNINNNNGYDAVFAATGPLTTSTQSAVTTSFTWGGSFSDFATTNVMLFVNPAGGGGTSTPTPTPSTTPTATPAAGLNCTNGAFSAPNHFPDVCSATTYVPWATSSVWNKPLSSYSPALTVISNSATYANYYQSYFPMITGFGGKTASQRQYGHPVYFGQSTDATYTVHCTQDYAQSQCPTGSYHIPSYAAPAGGYANDNNSSDGGDHHQAVVDQTDNIELDCWRGLSRTGGVMTADACSAESVTGDGLNGQETRSGYRLWAGVIRQQELVAANIPHALFLVVPCTNAGPSIFPAVYLTGSDTLCPNGAGPPYGSLIRLNMSDAQINALNAPAYRKAIYFALAHYGAYIADANNFNSVGFQMESDDGYINSGYTNPGCPTNGAPCDPATAFEHSLGDPDWNGSGYQITLNDITYNSTTIQFMSIPPH